MLQQPSYDVPDEMVEHMQHMETLLREEIVPRLQELNAKKSLTEGEIIERKKLHQMAEHLIQILNT